MCATILLLLLLFTIFVFIFVGKKENYVTQHIRGNQIMLKKHPYDDGDWSALPFTL